MNENEPLVVCPLEIEIAIHYHCFPGQYRDGDFSAPAVKQGLMKLERAGLLLRVPKMDPWDAHIAGAYISGPALPLYLKALCQVKFPVQAWVMP